MCFVTKNRLVFPILTSDQEFENLMNLLLVINENKSHYEYIKDFDRFSFTKQIIKTKNNSPKVICSVLVVQMC